MTTRGSGLVRGVIALGAAALAASAQAQTELDTVRIASGLSRPVFVTHAPGDFGRIFIVEQVSGNTGRIRILDLATGKLNPVPFLSVNPVNNGDEQGLLGLAFDPAYADNGQFYVYYTAPGPNAGYDTIARYTVSDNPDVADPASATPVLAIADPESNHNGGWISFGPDGFLYIAIGDGGGGNDQHGQFGNGQNKNILLAKILRLDVHGDDFPNDPARNYAIPKGNPFVGVDGADEIWAYGLRNPWRDSFDDLTGDLWIGDVGQNVIEEVDVQPAGAAGGANYGWRCMEGDNCTGLSGCTCNDNALTYPVHTYDHNDGRCAVTGGYIYRGCAIPDLDGTYFFGDYCAAQIWSFRLEEGKVVDFTERTFELAPGGGLSIGSISSFGEDAFGEIYICDLGGEVFKIVPHEFVGPDCNANSVNDACDILSGFSQDANGDGIPDECQQQPCYADCDGNQALDLFDFLCYTNQFNAQDPAADCIPDGFLDLFDFLCFVNEFNAGC